MTSGLSWLTILSAVYISKIFSKSIYCDPLSKIANGDGTETAPFKTLEESLVVYDGNLLTLKLMNSLSLKKTIEILGKRVKIQG